MIKQLNTTCNDVTTVTVSYIVIIYSIASVILAILNIHVLILARL